MEEDPDHTTMDACLIAAGQRAEHYEMAAYGTLVAWARMMGHSEAADLLQQTVDEENAADKKLSDLAEGGINQGAADPRTLKGNQWVPSPDGAERPRQRPHGDSTHPHTVSMAVLLPTRTHEYMPFEARHPVASSHSFSSRKISNDTFEEWNRRDGQ
jgi:hypothetical protein